MDKQPEQPYCLVTITDEAFAVATEVLIYSFLKYNPWFEGDIVVIEDGLPSPDRHRLSRLGPVRFESPDGRLREKTAALRERVPALGDVYKRFYSFEVFRQSGYARVLYLDSDIYCVGDVAPLFTRREPLLACPDGFTYGDRVLARLSDANEEQPAPQIRYGRAFSASFNAGVLSVGAEFLGEQTYAGLLHMLDYDVWTSFGPSKFTDQMALNLYFENRFAELAAVYNYMIFIEEYQKCLEGICSCDAKLVHFAGPIKPWNRYDRAQLFGRAPQFIRFVDVWRELLEEARDGDRGTDIGRRYRHQKAWIASFNQDPLSPEGRIW